MLVKDECELCGATEELIKHHVSYGSKETLAVCRSCHGEVHSDPDHPFFPKDSKPKGRTEKMATRIPHSLARKVREIIGRGLHVSNSDFLRDAIKFYIRQRWPDIYAKYSGEKIERE